MVAPAKALTFAQTTPFTVPGWRKVRLGNPSVPPVADAPVAEDPGTVALRDQLQAKCRDHLRQLGADGAIRWLLKPEAHSVFGAKRCWDMARGLADRRTSIEDVVVSLPWMDAWDERFERPPWEDVQHQQVRRHSAKMVLSDGLTAVGDGPFTQRFTPPQAVAEEDRFDLLDDVQAAFLDLPASPSAIYIHRWRARNAPPGFDRFRECTQFTPAE